MDYVQLSYLVLLVLKYMAMNRLHKEVYILDTNFVSMMIIIILVYICTSVKNLLQHIKASEWIGTVLLICPQMIAGQRVDDKFFGREHQKEKDKQKKVFDKMLEVGDWKKTETDEELKGFNDIVTYKVYCYEK